MLLGVASPSSLCLEERGNWIRGPTRTVEKQLGRMVGDQKDVGGLRHQEVGNRLSEAAKMTSSEQSKDGRTDQDLSISLTGSRSRRKVCW